jgi:hypothetical protein
VEDSSLDQTPDGTKLLRNTVTQKIGYDVNNDVKCLITKNNRNKHTNKIQKVKIMRDSTLPA